MNRRTTYANLVSTAALVVALAGGGAAVAGNLGKNTVGSKQLKAGAVKTIDLKDDAVTGAKVAEGTLATVPDADKLDGLDSSAFARAGAPMPSVHLGARGAQSSLTGSFATYATVTFTAPAAGYARIDAQALFMGEETTTWVDWVLAEGGTQLVSEYWDAGDNDDHFDQAQSAFHVVPVAAGTHTYQLRLRESSVTATYSVVYAPRLTVSYFPQGSIG